MSFLNINNQFNKSFQVDIRNIVSRLKSGKVGDHIEFIMNTDEVQAYFQENLVLWSLTKVSHMSGEAKDKFAELIKPQLLWQNVSVNLSMNIFTNSLAIWMREIDKNLDDIIIDFVDVETVKKQIDALQEAYGALANQLEQDYFPRQFGLSSQSLFS